MGVLLLLKCVPGFGIRVTPTSLKDLQSKERLCRIKTCLYLVSQNVSTNHLSVCGIGWYLVSKLI